MIDQITINMRIGRLTIGKKCLASQAPPETPKTYLRGLALRWCECDCGKLVVKPEHYLKRGRLVSCGCAKAQRRDWVNTIGKLEKAERRIQDAIALAGPDARLTAVALDLREKITQLRASRVHW